VDPVFAWIEDGALSTWLRSSLWAFPAVLVLHTLGMGFVAGVAAAYSLRILGVAPRVPLAPLTSFLPVAWAALGVNVASGLLLLIAYPTKALTNPLFYFKLSVIAAGVVTLRRIVRTVLPAVSAVPGRRAKTLAALNLGCWMAAIAAGRLLAYTYSRLTVNFEAHF
jgi:hypothetical protein